MAKNLKYKKFDPAFPNHVRSLKIIKVLKNHAHFIIRLLQKIKKDFQCNSLGLNVESTLPIIHMCSYFKYKQEPNIKTFLYKQNAH
jgi:hypothetical protein